MLRKLVSPLTVQGNKRKYEKPFKSISWSGSENFNFDFWAEAKYSLVGPKIILVTLCSILLQTDNSLFPPLEESLHRTSNFPYKFCPCLVDEQDGSHPLFILHWKLS